MEQDNPNRESSAAACCARHHCEAAISALESAFAQQPCNAALSHQIGLCYSGSCRRHSQVSLPLAIAYFERALQLTGTGGPAGLRASCLDSLGNARHAHGQLAAALPLLEEAARLYESLGLSEDWARTEFNLGNLCCELAPAAASLWRKAVRHYRRALRVRTEKLDPVHFAATAQNLATAFRAMPAGDRLVNLRKAIRLYATAFRIYVAARLPAKCADLHNNLGNLYLSLPSPPAAPCKNIRRALRHYARALESRTRSQHPGDYAVTQLNRGYGYLMLAACDATANLQPAARCFHEALSAFLQCGDAAHAEIARHRLDSLAALTAGDGAPRAAPAPVTTQ